MKKLFNSLEQESNHALYLSLFRLFICFHLFKKIMVFISSGDILYSRNTFVASDFNAKIWGIDIGLLQDNYKLLLFFYILLIVFYLFGIGRYITALLLFAMVRLFQSLNGMVLNGGDNLLGFVMLYLVFSNSYDYFTLSPMRIKSEQTRRIANFFTNIGVLSIVCHLCLVYFISAIGKTNTTEWYKGVALYYTLMSERFNGTHWNEILANNGYFVTFGTYFTLLFEFLFPFLVWNKQWRNLFIVSGIMLHLSIYVLMMIHDFEFLFIAIYGFFYADSELIDFKNFFINQYTKVKQKLTVAHL